MLRAVALLAFTLIAGCSTAPSGMSHVTFSEGPLVDTGTQQAIGSGVQWTTDYALTAANVYIGQRSEGMIYLCQDCNLKFVPKRSGGAVPKWREPEPHETLYLVGSAPGQGEDDSQAAINRVAKGRDTFTQTKIEGAGDQWVNLAAFDALGGLSSGPVYGSDGKAVGYLTGFVELDVDGALERRAVYVPYSLIKAHWNSFNGRPETTPVVH